MQNQKLKINEKCAWRRIGEEIFIISSQTGEAHHLNCTASLIWDCIEGGFDKKETVDRMKSDYGVGFEQALADYDEFITSALEKRIIVEIG